MVEGFSACIAKIIVTAALWLFGATVSAQSPATNTWKVEVYSMVGDEEDLYRHASDLIVVGHFEEGRAIIEGLATRGYPKALRYMITGEWNPLQQQSLFAGCRRNRHQKRIPTPELERLAFTGDRKAIEAYWNCVTSAMPSGRENKDWRGAREAMYWLAKSGDKNAAGILFQYFLAGADWVRTPEDLRRYLAQKRRTCRSWCELPNPKRAAEMAELIGKLNEAADGALNGDYTSPSETMAWYYNADENYLEATRWATEAARRFSTLARYSWNKPWAEDGRQRMQRLAQATEYMSDRKK